MESIWAGAKSMGFFASGFSQRTPWLTSMRCNSPWRAEPSTNFKRSSAGAKEQSESNATVKRKNAALSFINGQVAVIQRQRQERTCRGEGGAELSIPIAFRRLDGAKGLDVLAVPTLPKFGRSMEIGLRDVIKKIGRILGVGRRLLEKGEGGREELGIFLFGQGKDHTGDGGASGIGTDRRNVADAAIGHLTCQEEL